MERLPEGPVRRWLKNFTFKDRRPLGILASDTEELRGLRRGTISAAVASILVAAYVVGIVERLPKSPQ